MSLTLLKNVELFHLKVMNKSQRKKKKFLYKIIRLKNHYL